MRVAYFDCFSGISGAMTLGALVDAGADLAEITERLSQIPLEGFLLEEEAVDVLGIAATRIHVHTRPQPVIRTYSSIRAMLDDAALPPRAKSTAQRAFRLLAQAQSRAHGKDVEFVTFHELGDLDALVDVIGSAIALDMLGVERVFASALPTGIGMIRTEHGMTPIPTPVVLELLQNVPTYSRGIPVELVTPTGAAILVAVAEGYGELPLMRPAQIGYGAGDIRLDFPNVLRVIVGEEERAGSAVPHALVQATVGADSAGSADLLRRLLEAGARSAWATDVDRPDGDRASEISALTPLSRRDEIVGLLRTYAFDGQVIVVSVSVPAVQL